VTGTKPRPMVTPDLAGLLGRPPRPAKMPDRPAEPESSDPVVTDNSPEESDAPPGVQEAERPAPQPRNQLASSAGDVSANPVRRTRPTAPPERIDQTAAPSGHQYLRSIAIYLPRTMHRTLGEHAIARGSTRTSLILNAVNHTHDQLGAELAADRPKSGGGDLFDIPQEKVMKEPSVQTTIRVTDRQLHAIDALVTALETNRSRLITAALTLYLTKNAGTARS